MESFLKAVNALVSTGKSVAGSLYEAIDGKFYLGEAPANSTLPGKYAVLTLDKGERIRSMGQAANKAGRLVPFIISVYANESSTDAAAIGGKVEALFDMAQLTQFDADTWRCRGCVEIGNPVIRHQHPYWIWAAKFQAWLDHV